MSKPVEYYDYYESFAEEWDAFESSLPLDDGLDTESTAFQVKRCCEAIKALMETLYEDDASYAVQMEIYLKWKTLEFGLEEEDELAPLALSWFSRQLANMIVASNSEVQSSIWYALSVNYFECGMDGYWLLPILYDLLPWDEKVQLIKSSGSVDWPGKIATYRHALEEPGLHMPLWDALYASCQAYCIGAIKSSEALPIAKALTISPDHQTALLQTLTQPVKVAIKDVIYPSPGMAKGMHCFVVVGSEQELIPTWFPHCELWIGNELLVSVEDVPHALYWDDLAREYGFPKPESHGKIVGVPVPLPEDWSRKQASLRPI